MHFHRCLPAVFAGFVVATAVPVSADAAGLFDFIFGGQRAAPQPSAGDDDSLTVHRYRSRKTARLPTRDRVGGSKPTVVAIDPVKVPDWHLKDPTLRRGDIVVLKAGAFVFDGSYRQGPRRPNDFTRVKESRTVSAAIRTLVIKATERIAQDRAACGRCKVAEKK